MQIRLDRLRVVGELRELQLRVRRLHRRAPTPRRRGWRGGHPRRLPGRHHLAPLTACLPLFPSHPFGIAATGRSDKFLTLRRYGEVVDVNLVRDKGTGKSKGLAFLTYEDQRSTILAVDNLNGAKVLGRIIRETQTLIGVLGMVNHQDQSSLETEILGISIMIGQKIKTGTGDIDRRRSSYDKDGEHHEKRW